MPIVTTAAAIVTTAEPMTTVGPTTAWPTPPTPHADTREEVSDFFAEQGVYDVYTLIFVVLFVVCLCRKRIWTCARNEHNKCFPHMYHSVSGDDIGTDDDVEMAHYQEAVTDTDDVDKEEHKD